ncbi:thyroid receptor-interacting protein 11-like [Colletes gigas]|uniref:thyroid receptor-interacting protein 11-like n=1 Tax=Colletes gigas TaxID=935657 RepID=UPI001C9AB2D4|nr:thyroid receptor-interacting protein 11-like [Colletes gigas]
MCSISTRLDTLNRQLMIISKLQNMDKEFDVHPHMTHCKKQQIVEATHANTTLTQERDTLKNRLESLTEDESKRCEEVEQEVNRMKCAVKVKENALNEVKAKFMDMIMELMNVIKIQKRRISEVTDICNNQQHVIYEKDEQLSQKITELLEVQNMLLSSNSTCKEMEEQVEHLRQCLCEETSACDCLKQELEVFKENHLSKMRIKEKIVDEQNKTISRQRKLLHDSEKMVQQVASEFDQLKAELCEEKQKNKFLQIKLDKTDNELSNAYLLECKKCRILKSKIDCLKTEKQRALTIAKFAYQKLNQSMKEYQKQLFCKEEQYRRMTLIVDKKEKEIRCLKTQIYQNSLKPIKEMNSCTL